MKIRFLRHATLIVEIGGLKILVDPMLSPSGASDAIPNTPNQRRNPLIDLPLPNEKLFDLIFNLDALLSIAKNSDKNKSFKKILVVISCTPAADPSPFMRSDQGRMGSVDGCRH